MLHLPLSAVVLNIVILGCCVGQFACSTDSSPGSDSAHAGQTNSKGGSAASSTASNSAQAGQSGRGTATATSNAAGASSQGGHGGNGATTLSLAGNVSMTGNAGTAGAPTNDTTCASPVATFCAGNWDSSARCDGLTPTERDDGYARCLEKASTVPFSCPFARGYADCHAHRDCTTSDDSCVFAGLIASEPPGWDVDVMRKCISGTIADEATCRAAVGGDTRSCINRLEECIGGPYAGATNAPFADDRCFTISALVPDARRAAMQCLPLACDAIRDCLVAVGTFNY